MNSIAIIVVVGYAIKEEKQNIFYHIVCIIAIIEQFNYVC